MASRVAFRLPLHLPLHRISSSSSLLSSQNAHATSAAKVSASFLSHPSSLFILSSSSLSSSMSQRSTFTLANNSNQYEQSSGQHSQTINHHSLHHQESHAEFHTSHRAPFLTHQHSFERKETTPLPGSIAFGECEIAALSDLFLQFAKTKNDGEGDDNSIKSNNIETINGDDKDNAPYLNLSSIKLLLESVGERPDDETLQTLMNEIDIIGDGRLRLDCFLRASDRILGEAPARIVLVVGGPGSGKGALCERLAKDCGAVHLSCGEMLRLEVEAQTPLGKEVADIMARGDLVSSAVVTALMRRRMRRHPGRRILLDGFPRSLENARDFVELCGPPELALHLNCDDTILIERILARGSVGGSETKGDGVAAAAKRSDDNVYTAIQRLKNYHKHHHSTMSWLKEIRVPIVELDCSGSKEDVWQQLMAIGRLMRPAVKLPLQQQHQHQQQQSNVTIVESLGRQEQQQRQAIQRQVVDVDDDLRWLA